MANSKRKRVVLFNLPYRANLTALNLTNLTNPEFERGMNQKVIPMAATQVNLYEAKTQLSSLVERAAKGEEIVIAKAGKPLAKLAPIGPSPAETGAPKRIFGRNLMGITYIADDFDAPLSEEELREWGL